jgi:MFS family permease
VLHDPKVDLNAPAQPQQVKWTDFKRSLLQLKRKDIYKPVFITTVLIVLMKFTGSVVLTTYLVDIMSGSSSAQDTKSYTYSMISQLLVMVSTFLSGFVIPMVGMKRVSAVAVAGAFVGLILLVTSSTTDVTEHVLPVHVIGIWLAMFMFHFGVANVSRAIISEAFPIDAKGFASIPMIMLNIAGATTLKLHPYLALRFGGNVYYGYATCTLAYGFYVHNFLPETVGKSLDEINKELS